MREVISPDTATVRAVDNCGAGLKQHTDTNTDTDTDTDTDTENTINV